MQSLLIIGYVWPESTATAAGSRMLQIIEQFKDFGCQVTFASSAQKTDTADDLSTLGIHCESIALNSTTFDDFIVKLNPTMVLFDRFMTEEQFGWRVTKNCPKAILILDSEDLHFLRKAREKSVKNNQNLPKGVIFSDEAKREIASVYRCDVTLIISEFEMQYLQTQYKIPAHLLWYFPFLVAVKTIKTPCFDDRQDFVFVGNFIHAPNWDAVLQLKEIIWPAIKKELREVNLHIYGGYPSKKVFQLENKKQGFYVHGRTKDVNEVMQVARVNLAPLRFGAGLKGKLIDAMQNNTPFVTTAIGAEGMFDNAFFSESIGVSTLDFVKKTIALYTNQALWNRSVDKGKEVLKSRFCKQNYTTLFKAQLNELIQTYEERRRQNFIGSMLQHHTLKSTMYLSKWIAEKNKHQNL